MVPKGLNCPHCRKENAVTSDGFDFDDDLNIICFYCSKVIFPTTEQAEQTLKHVVTTTGHVKKEPMPIKPLGESIILCETSECEKESKSDFVEGLA